ncbi:MAG TPA: hypothetical protein VM511_13455 [Luteolibacter sp.]|nr:hypothetical protein [Luteolibacter sp.]
MEPLHSSYSNLDPWKLERDRNGCGARIVFDFRWAVIKSVLLFVVCLIGSILAAVHLPADGFRDQIIGICLLTGVVVSPFMIARASRSRKRAPLLVYDAAADFIDISKPPLKIENASRRVAFSSEDFSLQRGRGFELNLVLDGRRKKFLSSISNFRRLAGDLREMGFQVFEYKVKL